MEELKTEYLPLSALTPYEGNARKHTEEDVSIIAASIKEYGFNDPIGIWGENNVIVEGHGRLLAAKMLGMEKVPCIRLDHMSEEQRRAYALVHNKTTELSSWDEQLLKGELSTISIDMTKFGFEPLKIEIEDIDGDFPVPEEPIAKELGEANNYVVLEFFTEQEWDDAQVILNLQTVQTAHKHESIRRHGIGRVIGGAEILKRLTANEH